MRGIRILAAMAVWCASQVSYAECTSANPDESIKNCLAQDLRDSDQRINAVYKVLMTSLDDAGKSDLREQQRGWLKKRDKTCGLSNKESDREKWLQSILADQDKTMCVVRYTFGRVAELDSLLKQKAPALADSAPKAPKAVQLSANDAFKGESFALPASLYFEDDGYKAVTATSHERGKWYFEVWMDRGKIAEMGDLLTMTGFISRPEGVIHTVSIRRPQAGMGPVVLGLALDLDGGYVYSRQNGQWKTPPGVAGATVVRLNRPYVGRVEGSSDMRELIRHGLIRINIGERPFENPLPTGYRAWGEN